MIDDKSYPILMLGFARYGIQRNQNTRLGTVFCTEPRVKLCKFVSKFSSTVFLSHPAIDSRSVVLSSRPGMREYTPSHPISLPGPWCMNAVGSNPINIDELEKVPCSCRWIDLKAEGEVAYMPILLPQDSTQMPRSHPDLLAISDQPSRRESISGFPTKT